MASNDTLSLVWAGIIAIAVFGYVVMDGFDLGLGILFPGLDKGNDRNTAINTIAPVWDGNETWLVLGGAALFGAFPLAYGVILEALYLPLILMLCGLIFRGVAFEFRFKSSPQKRHWWDKAFIGGSLLATFSQGVAIGAYVSGIPVMNRQFAGGGLDWLAPFPLVCGVGLVVAYALLGSTWLLVKTEGMLESRMRLFTRPLAWLLLAMVVVIGVWTLQLHPELATRWSSHGHLMVFAGLVGLALLALFGLLRTLRQRHTHWPFVFTLVLMLLGYIGLALSIWPNIIPPSVSLWAAASPPSSQLFALIGALFILPVILMYTFWSYYVFRGKVRIGDGYH
jgi:cytochrome d ubiquinol oxidase subunit II